MARDTNRNGENFVLESELFPAFRKAMSAALEVTKEDPELPPAPEAPPKNLYSPDAAGHTGGMPLSSGIRIAGDEPHTGAAAPDHVPPPAAGPRETPEPEEKIPALFGDVCLDKYKKHEEPEHEPTLLEFLNQPLDEPPLPVPSLFEGIGRDYYASEEVLRLAAEAEAEEAAIADGWEDGSRESDDTGDGSVQPEEEPAPDAEELFGMISSIYYQQREDWDRHLYEKHVSARRKSDPYNTAFNSRQPVINYDNIDELPMEQKYTLTPVESASQNARAKAKPKTGRQGGRRHFKINQE